MRVVMRFHISGTRNGQSWPTRGSDIELPDDEAELLIEQGLAEPAAERAAIRPTAERATARKSSTRKD